MKILFILLITSIFLSANYQYDTSNKGKIDMHGGKNDALISDDKNSFRNGNFSTLGLGNKKSEKAGSKSKDDKNLIIESK